MAYILREVSLKFCSKICKHLLYKSFILSLENKVFYSKSLGLKYLIKIILIYLKPGRRKLKYNFFFTVNTFIIAHKNILKTFDTFLM